MRTKSVFFFFLEFQLTASASNDNFLLLDQDTNRFLMQGGLNQYRDFKISFTNKV